MCGANLVSSVSHLLDPRSEEGGGGKLRDRKNEVDAVLPFSILDDPGATSRDYAIFSCERHFRAKVYFKR